MLSSSVRARILLSLTRYTPNLSLLIPFFEELSILEPFKRLLVFSFIFCVIYLLTISPSRSHIFCSEIHYASFLYSWDLYNTFRITADHNVARWAIFFLSFPQHQHRTSFSFEFSKNRYFQLKLYVPQQLKMMPHSSLKLSAFEELKSKAKKKKVLGSPSACECSYCCNLVFRVDVRTPKSTHILRAGDVACIYRNIDNLISNLSIP